MGSERGRFFLEKFRGAIRFASRHPSDWTALPRVAGKSTPKLVRPPTPPRNFRFYWGRVEGRFAAALFFLVQGAEEIGD